MTDIFSREKRSEIMGRIKGRDTQPELILRRGLHWRGFRFLLHDARLPSRPDLVFPIYRAVIFVHGCFWHGHHCEKFRLPGSNLDYWRAKINRNQLNDERNVQRLLEEGWRVGVVWECAVRGTGRLKPKVILDV